MLLSMVSILNKKKTFSIFILCLYTDPPKIVSNLPESLRLLAGISAIIECNATGNPQPRITWRNDLTEIVYCKYSNDKY